MPHDSIDDGQEPRPEDEPDLPPMEAGTIGAGIEASANGSRHLRTIKLWLRTEAERDHFLSIYPAKEGSQEFINRAARSVEETVLPRIMSGAFGMTREEIGRSTDRILRAGLKEARKLKVDPDLRLCWRLSYQGHCLQVVDAFLEGLKAIEEATEALDLIAAGFTKATAAMERAARVGSPAAAPLPGLGAPLAQLQPHALALGGEPAPAASSPQASLAGRRIGDGARRTVPARPLRPEDLGALPALGRP